MQRRFIQAKVYCKLFYSIWKDKPWKVAAEKSLSQVCSTNVLLRQMFLFHVITRRHYLYKFIVTQRFSTIVLCCCVLWGKYFERSPPFISVISLITLQSQEKSLRIHEWERCGYSHLFSMNWEKIFPYIRKSMETSFPYMGIV